MLVYLLRTALQHKEICIASQNAAVSTPLTLSIPICYQLLQNGVRTQTPDLFQQAMCNLAPQWDMGMNVSDLHLQGILNSAVDILSRRIMRSMVIYDVGIE